MDPVAPLISTFMCASCFAAASRHMVAAEAAGRYKPCHRSACSHALLTRAATQLVRRSSPARRPAAPLILPLILPVDARAAGLCARGAQAAPLPLLRRAVSPVGGHARPSGEGADRSREVLYLRGDDEELAGRALRHLRQRLEVEEAQGFLAEVGTL